MMKMATILTWVKKFWVYAPLLLLGWGWFHAQQELTKTQTTLTSERQAWKNAAAISEKTRKDTEARYSRTMDTALSSYTAWVDKQKPIILQSTNTVREYEKTTAGKSVCLDADGVQRLTRQTDLFYAQDPAGPEGSNTVM